MRADAVSSRSWPAEAVSNSPSSVSARPVRLDPLGRRPERERGHLVERMVDVHLAVPIRGGDAHPHRVGPCQEVPQERRRGLRRPLEVVEDQQHRVRSAHHGEQTGDGCEELESLLVRADAARGGATGVAPERWEHLRQMGPVLREVSVDERLRYRGDEAVQRLHERAVGHSEVLVAAPEQGDPPVVACVPRRDERPARSSRFRARPRRTRRVTCRPARPASNARAAHPLPHARRTPAVGGVARGTARRDRPAGPGSCRRATEAAGSSGAGPGGSVGTPAPAERGRAADARRCRATRCPRARDRGRGAPWPQR